MNLIYIDSPPLLSQHDWFIAGVTALVIFIIWLLRHTLIGGILWWNIRTLFMVIFAIGLVDYSKKEIKDWWDK